MSKMTRAWIEAKRAEAEALAALRARPLPPLPTEEERQHAREREAAKAILRARHASYQARFGSAPIAMFTFDEFRFITEHVWTQIMPSEKEFDRLDELAEKAGV